MSTLLCPSCRLEVQPFMAAGSHLHLPVKGDKTRKEACYECRNPDCERELIRESQCVDADKPAPVFWWTKW